MRRREFLGVLGGAAAAWPLTARAQRPERIRRLGVLMPAGENDANFHDVVAFTQSLRDLGWKDGENIRIDYRWAGTDIDRIRSSASELVALKPDAILAATALTVTPLQQMTSTVPIVFVQIVDPLGGGFVASLAKPGGNVTGFTPSEYSVTPKMVEVLKGIAPTIKRVTVIYHAVQAPQVGMWQAIQKAAPTLGVEASVANVDSADDITRVIDETAREPGGGIVVLPNPITISRRGQIIALAAQRRIPASYAYSYFVKEGGLLSYGADTAVGYRQAATYVDRILKGANPGDLPVQQPTKYGLAINLKTANALGLTISRDFLLIADEVIE
jgi:putative ABC transport system substrate-binding protein